MYVGYFHTTVVTTINCIFVVEQEMYFYTVLLLGFPLQKGMALVSAFRQKLTCISYSHGHVSCLTLSHILLNICLHVSSQPAASVEGDVAAEL